MSDARLAALEAVAAAADRIERFRRNMWEPWKEYCLFMKAGGVQGPLNALNALDALDALRAPAPEPAGEVVEVAIWTRGGIMALTTLGSVPTEGHPNQWTRLGAVKLTVERGE